MRLAIEMLSGSQVSKCCGQGLGSGPNGAANNQILLSSHVVEEMSLGTRQRSNTMAFNTA